jgi:predicted phosphodiesterase
MRCPKVCPAQVAEALNSVAERVIAVRGNCDSEVDQMLLRFPTALAAGAASEPACF